MGTACSDPTDFHMCTGREESTLTGAGPGKPPSLAPCPRPRAAGGRPGLKQGLPHCKPAGEHQRGTAGARGRAETPALAGLGEPPPCPSTASAPLAPYHDATPAGAVEGVGAHGGSVLVLDEQRGVGALWHVQQEVQHGVERGSAGACSGEKSQRTPLAGTVGADVLRAAPGHSPALLLLPQQALSRTASLAPSLPSGAGRAWCCGEGRGTGTAACPPALPPSLSRAWSGAQGSPSRASTGLMTCGRL